MTTSWQTGRRARPLAEVLPGEWIDHALCAQVDAELFFPEQGNSSTAAKLICRQCAVKDACLDYALHCGLPTHGVWGGTTERDRQEIRRQAGIPSPLEPIRTHGTEAGAQAHYRRGETPCRECLDAASLAQRQRNAQRREQAQ